MGLFSDLDKLGLQQFKGVDIYEDKKKSIETKVTTQKEVVISEKDILFEKGYICPVCDNEFRAKTIKVGKNKSCGHDTDLRPKYAIADALKYDAITCPKCGYSALVRFFTHLTSHQIRQIKADISQVFKGIDDTMDVYSYDDAILRHKLALACCIVKCSKFGERAYTCLKIAWLIRGKMELLDENDPSRKNLEEQELECIRNAYEGFLQAFSKETFPIAGMDEETLTYLESELAFRLKEYENSLRLLAKVIQVKHGNKRIHDEALDLKDRIRAQIK